MKVILPVAVTWAALIFYLGPAIDLELASGAEDRAAAAEPSREANGQPHGTYQGRGARWWARRAVQARKDANARAGTIRRLKRELTARQIGPTLAIRLVFGERAAEALRVAWCESRWYTGAHNGQYRGLFQMGAFARSTYGHGRSALEQARAAYRYFVASGYDWSPWACRP